MMLINNEAKYMNTQSVFFLFLFINFRLGRDYHLCGGLPL